MKLDEILKGKWEVQTGPVLSPSRKGWDSFASMTPVVFLNESYRFPSSLKFGMLFIGAGSGSSSWGVGYAESPDLRTWRKHGGNPLLIQRDGRFGYLLDAPCLFMDGHYGAGRACYRLFCEEKVVENGLATALRRILNPKVKTLLRNVKRMIDKTPTVVNHARGRHFVQFSSEDPLVWDSARKKSVFRGGNAAFESEGVFSPQIYKFGGRHCLFYGGTDGKRAFTGLAFSDTLDGIWKPVSAPVLSPGGKGQWDEMNALIVSVIELQEGGWCAFYEGEDRLKRYRIGIAYSMDLMEWTKWEGNPVIDVGDSGSYMEQMVCGPRAFVHEGRLYLFFNAHSKEMSASSGLAILSGSA